MLLNHLGPQFIIPCLLGRILIWRIGKDGGELHVWMGGNNVNLLINISYTIAMTIATLPNSETLGSIPCSRSRAERTTGITEHVGAAHILTVIDHVVKQLCRNRSLNLR